VLLFFLLCFRKLFWMVWCYFFMALNRGHARSQWRERYLGLRKVTVVLGVNVRAAQLNLLSAKARELLLAFLRQNKISDPAKLFRLSGAISKKYWAERAAALPSFAMSRTQEARILKQMRLLLRLMKEAERKGLLPQSKKK